MVDILLAIGSVATTLFTQVGSVFDLFTTSVVLQIGLGIFVVGAGVGLVKRVIRSF